MIDIRGLLDELLYFQRRSMDASYTDANDTAKEFKDKTEELKEEIIKKVALLDLSLGSIRVIVRMAGYDR